MGLQKIKTTPKEKSSFSQLQFIAIFFVIVLALFIAYSFLPTEKIDRSISEEKILKVAMQEQAVQYFISKNKNYNVSVVKLSPKNITSLAEEFPALYGDLPKAEIYQVMYTSNEDSLFVIIDKNLKVLKYFKFYAVNLL